MAYHTNLKVYKKYLESENNLKSLDKEITDGVSWTREKELVNAKEKVSELLYRRVKKLNRQIGVKISCIPTK